MAKIKTAIEDFRPDPRLIDERGPTPERLQRKTVNPVSLALNENRLTREQFVAAEKLYLHWLRSGLHGSIGSIDLLRIFGNDRLPITEKQNFHRQRLYSALDEVERGAGAISVWVLVQVVIFEKPLVDIGQAWGHKNRNSAVRSALDRLRSALDILCTEWGVI